MSKKLSKKIIGKAIGSSPRFILLNDWGDDIFVKLQPSQDAVLSEEIDLYGLTLRDTSAGGVIGYEAAGFISTEALHRKMRALRWLEKKLEYLCERVGDPLNFGSTVAYCAYVLGVEEILISGEAYPIRKAVRQFLGESADGKTRPDVEKVSSEGEQERENGLLDLGRVEEIDDKKVSSVRSIVQPGDTESGRCSSGILEVVSDAQEDQ
jgi:hypothetical protein